MTNRYFEKNIYILCSTNSILFDFNMSNKFNSFRFDNFILCICNIFIYSLIPEQVIDEVWKNLNRFYVKVLFFNILLLVSNKPTTSFNIFSLWIYGFWQQIHLKILKCQKCLFWQVIRKFITYAYNQFV